MSTPLLRHACGFSLLASLALAQGHNYSEAFQKSLLFYEIQHSGPIPLDHRVEWRGPATIRDGDDVGRDLSGGWFDAGDGVVWTGNDAFGASMLAWSLVKYRDVYIQTGQYQIAMDRLGEISDYLTKIVQLDGSGNITRIYCGKGSIGHKPPNDPAIVNDRTVGQPNELLDTLIGGATQSIRPSYWVDSVTGGADIAGAVSSALASASIAFRDYGDATRANQLLALSKKVFAWGDANRNLALTVDGVATKVATRRITNGGAVTLPSYASRVERYIPRMIYAAAWLHRADLAASTAGYTDTWVNKAESLYNEPVNTSKFKHWESFATGSEHNGAYAMLAADSGRAVFVTEANAFANFWLYSRSNTSGLATDPTVTPGGFIARGAGASWNVHTFLDTAPPLLEWADSARNTNATQKANLVALFTGTYGAACPVKQIDYILGSNPLQLSYLAGYKPAGTGYDWPRNLHHRALGLNYGGLGTPAADKVQWNVNIPYGMVVPGPNANDYYPVSTPLTSSPTLGYQEPIIYSGGILTLLARNIRLGGPSAGAPLGTFPDWQTRPADYQTKFFFVQAKTLSSTSVEFELNNRHPFPPRENDTLGFRYYFVPDGTAGSNVTCTATGINLLAGESVSVSAATQVGSTGTWYFAVTFNDAMIVPAEYNRYRRIVRLNFSQTGGGTFSLANDPSDSTLTTTLATVANLPVYDTSFSPWKILGGYEPSGAGYIQWRRAHYNNVMESAGAVVLIAERVGGSTGAVSATVSLANGTATAPADYGIPASTTLTWSNGQTGEKTLSVPIVDDAIDEGRHHFTATLGNFSGGAVAGITTTARVSIEDDDYGSTQTALVNQATGGTSATSSTNSPPNETVAQAFDGNANTKWLAYSNSGWISYTFGGNISQTVTRYAITSANDMPARDPCDWQLQGSTNGTTWVNVDTRAGQTFASRHQRREFTVSNPGSYRMYRLNITATQGGIGTLQLAELELLSPSNPGTLLTYEGFNYTASAGITGLSGGSGWRSPSNPSWATGGTTGTITASGLTYTAINPTYTSFAPTGRAGDFGGVRQNNRLPAIDAGGVYANAGLKATDGNYLGGGTVSGTLWGSFLVAANSWSSPQLILNLDSTTGAGTKLSLRQASPGSALTVTDTNGGGIGATGGIPITSLSTTMPNLIVFRYVFNGPANDTFHVWLNPASANAAPDISVTSANFVLNNLVLRSVNANGGLVFDELRLGTGFGIVRP